MQETDFADCFLLSFDLSNKNTIVLKFKHYNNKIYNIECVDILSCNFAVKTKETPLITWASLINESKGVHYLYFDFGGTNDCWYFKKESDPNFEEKLESLSTFHKNFEKPIKGRRNVGYIEIQCKILNILEESNESLK